MNAAFRVNLNVLKLYVRFKNRTFLKDKKFISYKHQSGQLPFLYKTVGQVVDEAAEKYGDKIAFISHYQKKKVSFKEVKEQSEIIAAALYGLGGKCGDRVGIWAGNSVEWYITSFGIAKAGLVSVYLNPAYLSQELEHCLNAVGVKILFMDTQFKEEKYIPIIEKFIPEIKTSKDDELNCEKVPTLKSIISFRDPELPAVIPYRILHEKSSHKCLKELKNLNESITPDDNLNIQFTSGTTGLAKGATLSHFGVINNAYLCMNRLNLEENEENSFLFMGPLFHALGSVVGILCSFIAGIPLVIPDEAYSPTKAVEALLQENSTVLIGTPTMYVDIIKILKEKGVNATSPQVAISGGAYASPALFNDMLTVLGLKRIASVYGLTEAGPITFMSMHDDSKEQMLTTVGALMDYGEAKVVNEHGAPLPLGSRGELWVRNYGVTKGYFNNEIKTKEAITDAGWFKTGDQFVLTEEGYGKIVGRIKDMIIRGGENIYPADIEDIISSHKDVESVEVVGVPDSRLGEHVCACIILVRNARLTAEEVKHFCKGKMAAYKIPQYVVFMEEFPKTASGKIQKFILRKQAMELLNIQEL